MPGRCAAPPAPAMMQRSPRPRAPSAYSNIASGVRCADTTRVSCATPKSFSTRTACCMTSQSLSDPMTTPTKGFWSISARERARVVELAAIRLEDALQRRLHVHLRRPAELGHGVLDLRHPVLHVLVSLAVVLARAHVRELHLRGVVAIFRILLREVEHHRRELAHREVVARIADIV